MHPFGRRQFLGTSFGSLAAAMAAGPVLLGKDPKEKEPKEIAAVFTPTAQNTLFLTWQRDPTTTMTVQWIGTEAGAAPAISYAPATSPLAGIPAPAWQTAKTAVKPFPLTEYQVFRAELTGLTPGTDYQFRVGTDPAVHRFRTMPAKLTDSFHFVSGGDCGINSHAIANNQIAAKQDPWFVLIGGDLGYDNGRLPKVMLAWLRNYSQHLHDSKGRLIPMVVCIGNHEVDGGTKGGYGKTLKEAPLFHALFDGLFTSASYATLDFGDYLSLVLLDTGHAAKIEGEQTDWLGTALRERQDRAHLIAVNHVPAYPSYRAEEGTNGKVGTGEGNRTHWVPLFERYNVDAVLEHHDHTFKRTHPLKGGLPDKNGILYLGDGSWGRLRAPKNAEKRPYLATTSQTYHLTLHRLEGEQRFHVALEETGRVVDVCMSGKKPRRRG